MSKTAGLVSGAVLGVSIVVSACGGSPAPEPHVAEPVASAPAPAERPAVETANTDAAPAPAPTATEPATAAPARGKRPPCELGRDQTCNSDPSVSALWGKCTEAGTCECKPGFTLAPTGYCQPQADPPAQ